MIRKEWCSASVLDGRREGGQVTQLGKKKQENFTWRWHCRRRWGGFVLHNHSKASGDSHVQGGEGDEQGHCSHGFAGRRRGGGHVLPEENFCLHYRPGQEWLSYRKRATHSLGQPTRPRTQLVENNKSQEARLLHTNRTQTDCSSWNT